MLVRLAVMLLLVAAAAVLGELLQSITQLGAWDRAGVTAVSFATGPAAAHLAAFIDLALGPRSAPFVALAAIAPLVLLVPRLRRTGEVLRIALLVVVPWGAAVVLKFVVQRPRPDAALSALDTIPTPVSFSYPSGHTAIAAALCCAVLLSVRLHRGRWLVVALSVLTIGATGWSRVALGVHHPGDVLVSALLIPALAVLLAGVLDAVGSTRSDSAASAPPATT